MGSKKDYNIGKFTDVATVWGDQLWTFLNEPSSVTVMTSASDSGRPAAEAVASALYKWFGESVKQHRVKQFTGFLIRQVMEKNGYTHISYHQKTHDNPVFIMASIYAQKGPSQIKDGKTFFIYENWAAKGHQAHIHLGSCSSCNNGKGKHKEAGDKNGCWHGPFSDFSDAESVAQSTGGVASCCKTCKPQ